MVVFMHEVYKPSGKVSFLFMPVYAAMLFVAALTAFICIFCIHFSPYSVFDAAILVFVTAAAGKYGALWCVNAGKIRNPAFSVISGLFLAIFYWYMLVVFYLPVKNVFILKSFYFLDENPLEFLQVFRLQELLKALSILKHNGAGITGRKGNIFFTMPGTACIVILSILCIITAIYFMLEFYEAACYPFCETSGKWFRETVLSFYPPDNKELFLSKLLLGDFTVIYYLEPLYEVNVNYYKIYLFTNNLKDKFYISLSYMENSGKLDKKTGQMVFSENILATYLSIDNNTGRGLLAREHAMPEDATARIVTDKTKKSEVRWLAFNWVIGILAIILCVFAIFKLGSSLPEFLFKGGFFYIALIFLINAVRFIHSMQKETVIESTEDRYIYDGTKKHLSREIKTPVMFKLFYLFMMVSAIALFVLCIILI